jgi:hypothetical protein
MKLPQGYEPHELPADYTGPLYIEGQMVAMVKQAKREALLEAAESLQVDQWTSVSAELRRMAEEL